MTAGRRSRRRWRAAAFVLLAGTLGCGGAMQASRDGSPGPGAAVCPARSSGSDATAPDAAVPTAIRVLVWNSAFGYGHQSRFTAIPLLQAAAAGAGIALDTSYAHVTPVPPEGQPDSCSDPGVFTDEGLEPYDVVLFLNTTGLTLDGDGQADLHRQALADFITKKGRGFVGIHAATDTYDTGWPWYSDFIGANFRAHSPAGTTGTATVAAGVQHPILAAAHVPNPWTRSEEWYAYDRDPTASPIPGVTVLLDCADSTGTLGTRPSAWVHDLPGGGRMFYTAFGHAVAAYREPPVMDLIVAGIQWAGHRLD